MRMKEEITYRVGVRKLKGNYYARIRRRKFGKRKDFKLISLNTKYKRQADKRRFEIDQNLNLIIDGEYLPSWKREYGDSCISGYMLSKAKKDFIRFRETRNIRKGTIALNEIGLNRLLKAVKDIKVNSIDTTVIDYFIEYYTLVHKLSPTSINIDLRTFNIFFKWLKERKKTIDEMPKIGQLNVPKQKPIYLSNNEFELICNRVETHYQRAFYFYRETGVRLSEPFIGELDGNFLIITADKSKSRTDNEFYIEPNLIPILKEMRAMMDEKIKLKIATLQNAIDYYSKVFRKACKGDKRKGIPPIKNRKFHSLRHTCAVRTYLKTHDIYAVMKKLGHSSVTTTEIYSKFDDKRLAQDFSDLIKNPQKQAEMQNGDTFTGIPACATCS